MSGFAITPGRGLTTSGHNRTWGRGGDKGASDVRNSKIRLMRICIIWYFYKELDPPIKRNELKKLGVYLINHKKHFQGTEGKGRKISWYPPVSACATPLRAHIYVLEGMLLLFVVVITLILCVSSELKPFLAILWIFLDVKRGWVYVIRTLPDQQGGGLKILIFAGSTLCRASMFL